MLPAATEKLSRSFFGTHSMSYVNLICSDDNLAKFLQVKVSQLPLIAKVEEYAIANIQSTITKTLSDLDITSPDQADLKKMVGLRIFFDEQVSVREFELIKGHLNRLTTTGGLQGATEPGEREIIWGPFVQGHRLQAYANYFDWALYGMIFIIIYLIWLVNFLSIKHLLLQAVYVVERYQRRSRIYPKVMIIFIGLNVLLGLPLVNKKILSTLDGFHLSSGELMPIFFYCVFILCITMTTLDVQRFWKKV